ncbi:hypothetical protein X975_17802, partial [Stegodyphus mimosarum]
MQEIWCSGAGWDEVLPAEINIWRDELRDLTEISIQRNFFDDPMNVSLHLFSVNGSTRSCSNVQIFKKNCLGI